MNNFTIDSLDTAVFALRHPLTPFEVRLHSLRYLKQYVARNHSLDSVTRKKINQLVFDNVLDIVLGEERTADLRKRQLVRTECFLMIAELLQSNTLFGDCRRHIHELQEQQNQESVADNNQIEEIENRMDDENAQHADVAERKIYSSPSKFRPAASGPLPAPIQAPTKLLHSNSVINMPLHSSTLSSIVKPQHSHAENAFIKKVKDEVLNQPAYTKMATLYLGRGAAAAAANKKEHSVLIEEDRVAAGGTTPHMKRKHRPTMFFNSEYQTESLYPGVKPTDWIGQDKKLGYQVSRMWYPGAEVGMGNSLLPEKRSMQNPAEDGVQQVVEEFLQMRAMLSYVGDLVLPCTNRKPVGGRTFLKDPDEEQAPPPRSGTARARSHTPHKSHTANTKSFGSPNAKLEKKPAATLDLSNLPGSSRNAQMPVTQPHSHTHTHGQSMALQNTGFRDESSSHLMAINPNSYEEVVAQAVKVWTPILGLHVPNWANQMKHTHHKAALEYYGDLSDQPAEGSHPTGQDDEIQEPSTESIDEVGSANFTGSPRYGGGPAKASKHVGNESARLTVNTASPMKKRAAASGALATSTTNPYASSQTIRPVTSNVSSRDVPGIPTVEMEKSVLFTKGVLRSLLKKEIVSQQNTKATLRDTLQLLTNKEQPAKKDAIHALQDKLHSSLEEEQKSIVASGQAIQTLMRETVTLQYATLPTRYLLVIEGRKANTRAIIGKAIEIFCRVKRTNWMAMAFGVWKIILITALSADHRIIYHRNASIHLIHGWLQNRKTKKLRLWLQKFRLTVTNLIFLERNNKAIPLQTLYRRWRDRRILIGLHMAGPYNGPLSDIFLAPQRDPSQVYFTIPRSIRVNRRMYWLTAVIIQSNFRGHRQFLIYMAQRRYILLIGSVCRMWPKYCYYRRLKKASILCQSYMRRTVKRVQFLRLKEASLMVQKYVRRLLAILCKLRTFQKMWIVTERKLTPIIWLQCRWREKIARRRVDHIISYRKRRDWAALILQMHWYKNKNTFHTFLLMSCYRVVTAENDAKDAYGEKLRTFYAARVIQRHYTIRFFKRTVSSVVRVQCWFRGCRGYSYVDVLRKRAWATRKLHHWGRGMLKRKHAKARKIQAAWWRKHKGYRHLHLMYNCVLRDREYEARQHEKRHLAVCKIQGFIHGIYCRRWVKKERAARKIQKPLRFWLARKRWKREMIERSLRVIRRYVGGILGRAVYDRTNLLVKKHSFMMIRPQAKVRGFIVRSVMAKCKERAYKMGLSVIVIQRFWRRSGAFGDAVIQVMALRRMNLSPFKDCNRAPELIHLYRLITCKYYDAQDVRVGLLVSGLLQRLGFCDLLHMFPHKEFVYVADLKALDMKKMIALYQKWELDKIHKEKIKGKSQDKVVGKVSKAKDVPKDQFEAILAVVRPPLYSYHFQDRKALASIAPVQDVMSQAQCEELILTTFSRKFGKNLLSRAQNTSKTVGEHAYTDYGNAKGIVDCLTRSHIMRAIATGSAADVRVKIEEMRKDCVGGHDEKKWDVERVRVCAEMLQLAMDKAQQIFETGCIREALDKVSLKVFAFKRKFNYKLAQFKNPPKVEKKKEEPREGKGKKGKDSKEKTVSAVTLAAAKRSRHKDGGKKDPVVHTDGSINVGRSKLITAEISLELPFNMQTPGLTVAMIETEINVSICRMYCTFLNKVNQLNNAVQSLKNAWHNRALQRAMIKQKLTNFLDNETSSYLYERNRNKVHESWTRIQRIERIAMEVADIIATVKYQKECILDALKYVPKFGWIEALDDEGHSYWHHTSYVAPVIKPVEEIPVEAVKGKKKGAKPSAAVVAAEKKEKDSPGKSLVKAHFIDPLANPALTYTDMPMYNVQQWKMTSRIQVRARKMLFALAERHRLKEEAKARELAAENERFQQELAKARIISKTFVKLDVCPVNSFIEKYYVPPAINDDEVSKSSNSTKDAQLAAAQGALHRVKSMKPSSRGGPTRSKGKSFDANLIVYRDTLPVEEEELELPWRLRFQNCVDSLHTGLWVLLRHEGFPPALPTDIRYEIVIVCRVSASGKHCDVRNYKGIKFENVDIKHRITNFNIESGMAVEARYKGMLHFYKGCVMCIKRDKQTDKLMFNILYDDGEREENVSIDFVRLPESGVEEILKERIRVKRDMIIIKKRQDHFRELKHARLAKVVDKMKVSINQFGDHWSRVSGLTKATPPQAGKSILSMLDLSNQVNMLALRPIVKVQYTRKALRFGWVAEKKYTVKGKLVEVYKNYQKKHKAHGAPLYTVVEGYNATKIQSIVRMRASRHIVAKKLKLQSLPTLVNRAVQKVCKIAYIGYKMEGLTLMQMLRRFGSWDVADVMELHFRNKPSQLLALTPESLLKIKPNNYDTIGVFQQIHVRGLTQFKDWYRHTSLINREHDMSCMNYYTDAYDTRTIKACIYDSEEAIVEKFVKAYPNNASKIKATVGKAVVNTSYPITEMQINAFLKRYVGNPGLALESIYELLDKPTTNTYVEEREAFLQLQASLRSIRPLLAHLRLRRLYQHIVDAGNRAEDMYQRAPSGQEGRPMCSGVEAQAAYILRVEGLEYLTHCIKAAILLQKRIRGFTKKHKYITYMRDMKTSTHLLLRVMRGFLARCKADFARRQKESQWEQLWDSRRSCLYYFNYVSGESSYSPLEDVFRPLVRDKKSEALIQAWPQLDLERRKHAGVEEGDSYRVEAKPPKSSVLAMQYTKDSDCGLCHTRKCVRVCVDCVYQPNDEEEEEGMSATLSAIYSRPNTAPTQKAHPYCFPCFAKVHGADPDKFASHRYTDVLALVAKDETGAATKPQYASAAMMAKEAAAKALAKKQALDHDMEVAGQTGEAPATQTYEQGQGGPPLMCSTCDLPATRKCLGRLSDQMITDLVNTLQTAPVLKWATILSNAGVGGARKVQLLLGQLDGILGQEITGQLNKSRAAAASSADGGLPSILSKPVGKEPSHGGRGAPLTEPQCQMVRSMLEKTRAECDEVFCDDCYQEVHAGGSRATHHWVGFEPMAPSCIGCKRSPAEVNCKDCQSLYCHTCARVFHKMGRKRRHKLVPLLEPAIQDWKDRHTHVVGKNGKMISIPPAPMVSPEAGVGQSDEEDGLGDMMAPEKEVHHIIPCAICHRRVGRIKCANCHGYYCNSCFTCTHVKTCEQKGRKPLPKGSHPCVVCSNVADSKCNTCGDYYCSEVWMGNVGCFAKYHSKGNRLTHVCVPLA